jgi:hypothetical protein
MRQSVMLYTCALRAFRLMLDFPKQGKAEHKATQQLSNGLHKNVYGSKVRFMDLKGFADQSRQTVRQGFAS